MALLKLDDSMYVGDPVEKTITFINVNGEEVSGTVYVKQYGISQAKRLLKAFDENDDDNLAEGIAEHIVDEKGEQLYQAKDVQRFCQSLILALLTAIGEVNNPKLMDSLNMKNSSAN